ncbi:hypothetical protein L1987_54084 [Smallanthus sonchifolius]|uniref:Uncharacterized protein n=1 Tax=Smallanthus sonchifolius TaxID=185202 RepID=A0ACB9E747_9ASTR|nr:hypothetical protein L1987_54084 [Smallanthus sonchifolius]
MEISPFTLETGYVGVGEVQFFYYFVESQRDPLHDPLLLYLTGGPGTSAFFPFLNQIGPLSINFDNSTLEKVSLELNPNSWAKTANVIFVDLPVGTRLSYATTYEASRSSDSLSAQQSYKILIKWLEEHPRFINNPLYVTNWYFIYGPTRTDCHFRDIQRWCGGGGGGDGGNERGDIQPLSIKGCVIFSPLTDKFSDFNSRFEFAHRVTLISDDIYESAKESYRGNYVDNDPENVLCSNSLQRVDECTSRINSGNILDPYFDKEDPDPNCREAAGIYLDYYGNDKEVQKALNVREGTIEKFEKTNDEIHYAFRKADTEHYSYDIFSSIAY